MSSLKLKLKRSDQIIRKSLVSDEFENFTSNTKNIDNLELDDSFFQRFISALQSEFREDNEINLIVKYLKTLKDFSQLIKDSHSQNELIKQISHVLKYEKYEKDEMLFRRGDEGDKFYIILKGSVSILIPKSIDVAMSEYEYVYYLLQLKLNNEFSLLKKVVSLNKHIFHLGEYEIEKIKKNLSLKNSRKSSRLTLNLLDEYVSKSLNLNSSNVISISSSQYLKNLNPVFDDNFINEKRIVSIFEYSKIVSLKSGDKFGEIALSSINRTRVATVITDEECHFGTLDKKSYDLCLKKMNESEKKANINFILSNQIFKDCNKADFINNYFNLFAKTKLNTLDKIICEQTVPNKIFFIKQGEFLVTFVKSIVEMEEFLKSSGIDLKKDSNLDDLMKTSPCFYKFVNEKRLFKIAIYKDMEIIGLQNLIHKNKYIFDVKCISASGTLFAIDCKFFDEMVLKYKNIKLNLDKYTNSKINTLLTRLIEIRRTTLKMFLNKNKIENITIKNEKPIIERKEHSTQSLSNSVYKIKHRLNSNIDNHLENECNNNKSKNKFCEFKGMKLKKRDLAFSSLIFKPKDTRNIKISTPWTIDNLVSTLTSSPMKTESINEYILEDTNCKRSYLKKVLLNSENNLKIKNLFVKKENQDLKFTKNNLIDNIYRNYCLSENSLSDKYKFVDLLASDDFQRVFNTLGYYKTFFNKTLKKENLIKNDLKFNELLKDNNDPVSISKSVTNLYWNRKKKNAYKEKNILPLSKKFTKIKKN